MLCDPAAPTNRTSIPSPEVEQLQVYSSSVIHAIKTFPKRSTVGMDGLTSQHVQDMFINITETSAKTNNIKIVTDFVNFLLSKSMCAEI